MTVPSDHLQPERPLCTRSFRVHLIGVLVILVLGMWIILRYLTESEAVPAAAAAIFILLALAVYRQIVVGVFAVLAGVFAFLFLSVLVLPSFAFLFMATSHAEPWRLWVLLPMMCSAICIWTFNLRLETWAKELNDYERMKPYCHQCEYDLRGSLAVGGTTCPECGADIRENKIAAHSMRANLPPSA